MGAAAKADVKTIGTDLSVICQITPVLGGRVGVEMPVCQHWECMLPPDRSVTPLLVEAGFDS